MADSIDLAGPPLPKQEKLNKFLAAILALEAVVHVAFRVHAGTITHDVIQTACFLVLMIGTVWTVLTPSKTREGSRLRATFGVYVLLAFTIITGTHAM